MQKPLSAETIALVKSPVSQRLSSMVRLSPRSCTTVCCEMRISTASSIRPIRGDGGAQVNALAGAILAYAQNIDNLGALGPAVERIAHKHIGYHILPEHYPFVATALLGAICEVLGDAATEELLIAWGEVYWFLAHVLQAREQLIRSDIENRRRLAWLATFPGGAEDSGERGHHLLHPAASRSRTSPAS